MSDFDVEILSRKGPRRRRRKPETNKRRTALQSKRSAGAIAFGVLRWLLRPRFVAWMPVALVAVTLTYGTPHLLVTYRCGGVGTPGLRCSECRYIGVQGMREKLGPNWNCPVIAMLPFNWKAVVRTVVGE
jgi:hypothetical protein